MVGVSEVERSAHRRAPHSVLAVVAAVLACAARAHGGWETPLQLGGSSDPARVAYDVAVRAAGDVVAVGGSPYVAVSLDAETGTLRWRYDGGLGEALAVAVDPADDVIVAGYDFFGAPGIVKLAGDTGQEIWHYAGRPAKLVAVDAAGDVLVAERGFGEVAVTKIAGSNGTLLWEHSVTPGAMGYLIGLRLTSNGDAVVLGEFDPASGALREPVVVRLSGGDGDEQWRTPLRTLLPIDQFLGENGDLALTPTGDVAVSSSTVREVPGRFVRAMSVFSLAGASGALRWAHEEIVGLGEFAPAWRLAAHPSGDLIASGRSAAIARLSSTDGSVRWTTTLGCGPQDSSLLALDRDGNVLAVGLAFACFPARTQFDRRAWVVAAKLAPEDGAVQWRRLYGGARPGRFFPRALTASAGGRGVVAGSHSEPGAGTIPSGGSAFDVFALDADDGALGLCTDGFIDAGEECDAGEFDGTPCCTNACRIQGEGQSCDDRNRCTADDTCSAGVCTPGAPLLCEPCGTCTPSDGCRTFLPYGCRGPTASHKAIVSLDDSRRARDDAFTWKWKSGTATSKADFGDPGDATSYALCMFGEAGRVLFAAEIPSDAVCGDGRKCWHPSRRGFSYHGPAKPNGITSLSLRAGAGGRASIVARGRGGHLSLPATPLPGPVTMQLRRLDGAEPCWDATHSLIRTNRTKRFVATNE